MGFARMSRAYPLDESNGASRATSPITVCVPGLVYGRLRIVNQVSAPTGPFLDVLNRFPLDQLEDELAKVRGQMAQLNTAAQLLQLAIDTRRGANGSVTVNAPAASATATAPDPEVATRPKLKSAILAVLTDGPRGRAWSPVEVHAALDERGWAPDTAHPRSQISNRLSDLVRSGQVEKTGKGRYVLMRNDESGSAAGSGIGA